MLLSHKIMVCMYMVCVSVSHDYVSLSMFFMSVYVHVLCPCVYLHFVCWEEDEGRICIVSGIHELVYARLYVWLSACMSACMSVVCVWVYLTYVCMCF